MKPCMQVGRVKRPCALLFDLDGTLVDSRRDIADAVGRTLALHGRAPLALERVMPMIGDGARALVARAFDVAPDDPRVEALLSTFLQQYAARPCVETVLLPGAREALALGIPSAIVTNKPREITLMVLDALGIRGTFAAVRAGGDAPLKPDPAMLLSALAELGVAPNDAWMVGDGPQDVGAGKAAGCFTVLAPGFTDRERGRDGAPASSSRTGPVPDLVVETLFEVARILNAAET